MGITGKLRCGRRSVEETLLKSYNARTVAKSQLIGQGMKNGMWAKVAQPGWRLVSRRFQH